MAAELTVLTGADERDLTRLDEFRAVGGYASLEKARGVAPEALIEQINDAFKQLKTGEVARNVIAF